MTSTALHLLLLLVLLVGSAFVREIQPPPTLPLLDVIPTHLVDEAIRGGGSPPPAVVPKSEPAPAKTPPRKPPAKPADKPPVKPVDKPEEKPKAMVPKPVIEKPKKTEDPPPRRSTMKKSNQIKVSKVPVKSPVTTSKTPDVSKVASRVDRQISQSATSVRDSLSKATTIEMPGFGGPAYANWLDAVQKIYDGAWDDPRSVDDTSAKVRVRITVARNGKIVSSKILSKSGIPALDISVQKALNQVERLGVPKFPQGAKEIQRNITINFSLRSRRLFG